MFSCSTATMGNGAPRSRRKSARSPSWLKKIPAPKPAPADLHYLFAPLKAARLDYMVQKAVEMGVSLLQPVLTQHGQVARVSPERMLANAVEAAEQCGLLSLPEIKPLVPLADIFDGWNPERRLIFCDEDAGVQTPVAALAESILRSARLADRS